MYWRKRGNKPDAGCWMLYAGCWSERSGDPENSGILDTGCEMRDARRETRDARDKPMGRLILSIIKDEM